MKVGVLVSVFFFFLSCSPYLPEETTQLPTTTPTELKDVVQEVKNRVKRFQSLEGVCQVNLRSPQKTGNFSGVLLIHHPNQFRLIGYRSLLGSTTVLDLLFQGEESVLYLPTEKKAIKDSHGRFFSAKEMFVSFFGLVEGTFLLLKESETDYLFGVVEDSGKFQQALTVEKKSLWIREQTFYNKAGQPQLQITYHNYQSLGEGQYWPYLIKIKQKEPEQTLQILFSEVQLNQPLKPDAFQQEFPEETVIERVQGSHE